jgi:hypothetical protein
MLVTQVGGDWVVSHTCDDGQVWLAEHGAPAAGAGL